MPGGIEKVSILADSNTAWSYVSSEKTTDQKKERIAIYKINLVNLKFKFGTKTNNKIKSYINIF